MIRGSAFGDTFLRWDLIGGDRFFIAQEEVGRTYNSSPLIAERPALAQLAGTPKPSSSSTP